jgi:hypothetical protein
LTDSLESNPTVRFDPTTLSRRRYISKQYTILTAGFDPQRTFYPSLVTTRAQSRPAGHVLAISFTRAGCSL